jgi:hypothetical protein
MMLVRRRVFITKRYPARWNGLVRIVRSSAWKIHDRFVREFDALVSVVSGIRVKHLR